MYDGYKVTVCIPTLTQYDMLDHCIKSASEGTVKPDEYLVMDNGGIYSYEGSEKVEVVSYGYNIGVAKSWNYFINNTPEIRVICNDDIQFYPETLQVLLEHYSPVNITSVGGLPDLNAFSLFVFPTYMKHVVGLFDESISPNYAYFEDNDYAYRMGLKGYGLNMTPIVGVGHYGSATLKSMPHRLSIEHNHKFELARENYKRKWGGTPGEEKYTTPYNS